jgi:hypothetical protein
MMLGVIRGAYPHLEQSVVAQVGAAPRGWRSSLALSIDPNCASSSENPAGTVVATSLLRQIDAAANRWLNGDAADVKIEDYH